MRIARLPLAALLLLLVVAAAAIAQSTTVQGSGDIKKFTADNAQRAVKVDVRGLQGPCKAQYLNVDVLWGKKKAYRAEAGCYGADWIKALYYRPNRNGSGQDAEPVGCKGLKMAREDKVWHVVFPRKCISLAPDKVRVKVEGRNYAGSPMPGEAGPTKLLDRG